MKGVLKQFVILICSEVQLKVSSFGLVEVINFMQGAIHKLHSGVGGVLEMFYIPVTQIVRQIVWIFSQRLINSA